MTGEEKEDDQNEAAAVAVFVQKEVDDWDDEAISRARFKDLSGQRSDWEPLYRFWRDLILKVARHLRTSLIYPSKVKRLWFRRAGLSPLCLDRVLLEMYSAGDLLAPNTTFATASRISYFFSRAKEILWASSQDNRGLLGEYYILAPILEEQAMEVVNTLSENYWQSSCVVTMRKFKDVCPGSKEALSILDYLSAHGKAIRFVVNRAEPIQGVKVCLAPGAVSKVSDTDCTVLHLIWTLEKLEEQLSSIDYRYQKSKTSALASLKSGNRKIALRHVKEIKLASQGRERCMALLDRVEKVLQVITDAESSTKVLEAIQSSNHAIKENQISIEEVELCLQEVDENIDALKQVDNALESSATAYGEMHDEDIEDDFNKLLLEVVSETNQVPTKTGFESSSNVGEVVEETDALTYAFSDLNLKTDAAANSEAEKQSSMSKERCLEAA